MLLQIAPALILDFFSIIVNFLIQRLVFYWLFSEVFGCRSVLDDFGVGLSWVWAACTLQRFRAILFFLIQSLNIFCLHFRLSFVHF